MRHLILLSTLFFFGCRSDHYLNVEFIKKYGRDNFEEFKNYSVFIRSGDLIGEEIVFIMDENSEFTQKNALFVVDLNPELKKIKSTSCHLLSDSTLIDKKLLESLVLKFNKYPIGAISVDSNSNVFISGRIMHDTQMVRFSDVKYKTAKYENWEHVQDNWHINP